MQQKEPDGIQYSVLVEMKFGVIIGEIVNEAD